MGLDLNWLLMRRINWWHQRDDSFTYNKACEIDWSQLNAMTKRRYLLSSLLSHKKSPWFIIILAQGKFIERYWPWCQISQLISPNHGSSQLRWSALRLGRNPIRVCPDERNNRTTSRDIPFLHWWCVVLNAEFRFVRHKLQFKHGWVGTQPGNLVIGLKYR